MIVRPNAYSSAGTGGAPSGKRRGHDRDGNDGAEDRGEPQTPAGCRDAPRSLVSKIRIAATAAAAIKHALRP